MYTPPLKRIFLCLSVLLIVTLACDLSVAVTPTSSAAPLPTNTIVPEVGNPTQIPATAVPTPTISFEGLEFAVDPLSVVLSPALASGVRGIQVPRNEGADVPLWDVTPGHVQLKLEGYPLQDKLHEPQIFVYPAQAYAELFPPAFESMRRLNNIQFDPAAPIAEDQHPAVPFFNAQQVFASNIQVISFQSGRGVRFLTEYAQYPAPANNNELFYHFQGLTSDSAYYIVAILPITAPTLAETSDAGAPLPEGGTPYLYFADPNADMELYYRSVLDSLNATPSHLFTPTLDQLDLLIQSMRITL